jgi:hypothetical protein
MNEAAEIHTGGIYEFHGAQPAARHDPASSRRLDP